MATIATRLPGGLLIYAADEATQSNTKFRSSGNSSESRRSTCATSQSRSSTGCKRSPNTFGRYGGRLVSATDRSPHLRPPD